MPYSVLIALEDDSFIYIEGNKISVPKGSAVVLRGNVTHSGSEYPKSNLRYHIYIDTSEHVANEGSHVKWWVVEKRKRRSA
jgi:hypothetical protein